MSGWAELWFLFTEKGRGAELGMDVLFLENSSDSFLKRWIVFLKLHVVKLLGSTVQRNADERERYVFIVTI